MRIKTILLLIVAIAIAAFLSINWRVFATPANFSFLVGSVDVPIGVVIVGLLGLVILTVAVYVAVWQGAILRDVRRQSKELQAQRSLADNAEASRFTELATLVREEMSRLDQRFDAAVGALRNDLQDTERSIAATLAEMDDRMLRNDGPLT
jgi:hypothetical protein